MDFSWTAEQRQLRQDIVNFAEAELNEGLLQRDKNSTFNHDGWSKCGKFGIQGLSIPREYGGLEKDPLSTIYALEGLGYGCKDHGLIFSLTAHLLGCAMPLLTFGNEEQKKTYLPKLCSGELIAAIAMTEQETGSNAYGLKTTAEKQGNIYRLNGKKAHITNAPIADLIIVFATVDTSKGGFGITGFLVDNDTPGLLIGSNQETMGLRTMPYGTLVLEDCEVPASNILGEEGSGLALFNYAMEWERGFILAYAVGSMQRQLETCVRYAQQRQQFGQSISKFQMISSKIVDMRIRLENARMILYKVAWLKQRERSAMMESAMAKLFISEAWVQSSQDAIQIHGAYGYLTDSGLERDLRNAIGSKLHSGTSELQRLIIAEFMEL
jgi:alkylation response protein AidB-like acyl-CoA dehydrogenase